MSLKTHVAALLPKLGPWTAAPRIALAGGLVAPGGSLRDAVIAAVTQYHCVPLDKHVEPVGGAAGLALRDLRSDR